MKRIYILLSLILFSFSSYSQTDCISDDIHKQLMQTDSLYQIQFNERENQIQLMMQNINAFRIQQVQVTIPVVVHVIHLGEPVGTGTNISDAQIIAAINGANQRFNNTIANGNGVDTEIQFCLAVKDPNGATTTGINRVDGSGIPNYSTNGMIKSGTSCAGQPPINELALKNLSRWPNTQYYNIWVVSEICNGNVGGFAYFPGAGPDVDGTVAYAFGMNTSFSLLAHELGHGFNLHHTFNGSTATTCPDNTDCNVDGDRVCDTPPHKTADCGTTNPCSATGIFANSKNNYMSYCGNSLDRFTQGQKDRMQLAIVNSNRSILATSTACTILPLLCSTSVIVNVNCNGGNDGSASVTAMEGVTPYSYQWSNGNSTTTATGLIAGTYTVTVTDGNQSTSTCTVIITEPPVFLAACSSTTFPGGGNDLAEVQILGGIAPSNGVSSYCATDAPYNIGGGGSASGTFSIPALPTLTTINSATLNLYGLTSGGSAWLSDLNVSLSGSYVLAQMTPDNANVTGTSASNPIVIQLTGFPTSGGNITFDFINTWGGGTGALDSACIVIDYSIPGPTYAWSNGQTTAVIGGLSAGTYTVTVTDANNCTVTCSSIITDPSGPSCTITSSLTKTDESVLGANDGSITVTANCAGTCGTLQYSLNGASPQASPNFTGLAPGNYNVITSNVGSVACSDTAFTTILAGINTSFTCNVGITNTTDETTPGANDGSVQLNFVSNCINCTGGFTHNFSLNGGPPQSNAQFINLAPGNYIAQYTVSSTLLGNPVSCTDTIAFTINPAAPPTCTVTSSLAKTDETTPGANDGTITVTSSCIGACGTLQYAIVPGAPQASNIFTGLAPGTYIVITANVGTVCSETDTITILPATQSILACTTTKTDITCNNFNDGTATVSPSGGTPPYTFLWSDALSQSSATATGLAGGTYTVTVTDANQTTTTCSAVIIEPTLLTAQCSPTDSICDGGTDGTASVTAGGGVPPYTYLWSNGSTMTNIDSLSGGFYTVTVSDANLCTKTCEVWIRQDLPFEIRCSPFGPTCQYGTNGQVSTFFLQGGIGNINYLWSDGQTTSKATGLPVGGPYSVTATDDNGCIATCQAMLLWQNLWLSQCSGTDVTSPGGNDGEATVTVSDTIYAPYSYLWSNNDTTQTITGLTAGTYSVIVTDASGCMDTCSTVVNEPISGIVCTTTSTNISCNGTNDGTATVTPSNGTAPYTYLWSDAQSQTSATAVGLAAGAYVVTVTDANQSTTTCSANITTSPAITCSAIGTDETASGASDGTATVVANGGIQPYIYSWSNNPTTTTISNLAPGTYTVTVTDANQCTSSCEANVGPFDNNPDLVVTGCENFKGILVLDESGSILPNEQDVRDATIALATSLSGSGAQLAIIEFSNGSDISDIDGAGVIYSPGYNVVDSAYVVQLTSYINANYGPPNQFASTNWNAALLDALSLDTANICVFMTDGNPTTGGPFSTGVTRANAIKAKGTHMFGLAVGSGINLNNIAAITGPDQDLAPGDSAGIDPPFAEADYTALPFSELQACLTSLAGQVCVSCQLVVVDPLCSGDSTGSVSSTISGGFPPYTYNWSNGANTANLTGVPAGTYTLTVTDSIQVVSTCSLTVNNPPAINLGLSPTNASCATGSDGSINLTVSGGTGSYSYNWSNSASTEDISGLIPGLYTVTVYDNNQCSAVQSAFVGGSTSPISVTCGILDSISCYGASDGAVIASATGGTPPYCYAWIFTAPTCDSVLSNLGPSNYTVIVSDANQCTATCVVVLPEPPQLTANIVAADFCDVNFNIAQYANGTVIDTIEAGCVDIYVTGDGNDVGSIYPDAVVIFDSDLTNTADDDLEVNIGNLLILPTNLTDANNDSLVDDPCDNMFGGTITMEFSELVRVVSFKYIDQDDNTPSYARAYDASNNLLSTVTINNAGNKTVQLLNMGTDSVAKLVFDLSSSGAIAGLVLECAGSTPGQSSSANLDLTAGGGTPPYSYLWSNNATTEDISNVPSGPYMVTVTDANLCTATATAMIQCANIPVLVCNVPRGITCNGGTDGEVALNIYGGAAPFTILWSNGASTSTITNCAAGAYIVTVIDANGYVVSESMTLGEPNAIVNNVSTNDPTTFCQGESALLEAVYDPACTYQWLKYGVPIVGATSSTYLASNNGNFKVEIENSLGCLIHSEIIKITKHARPPASVVANNVTSICVGDSVALEANAGAYNYHWKRNGKIINGATDRIYYAKSKGNHKVFVTDANGCFRPSNKIYVDRYPRPKVTLNPIGPVNICQGSTIEIAAFPVGGPAPYIYQWYRYNSLISAAVNPSYTVSNTGGYSVHIVDANGCFNKSDRTVISEIACTPRIAKQNLSVDVYPNPFRDELQVDIKGDQNKPIHIEILNILGEVVYEKDYANIYSVNSIYLESLMSGVYLMKVSQGEEMQLVKVHKMN